MTWNMTLDELAQGSGGRIVARVGSSFNGVGTDTRADLKGKIFVALKGDRFDAHDFLGQAVASGASALLVHRLPEGSEGEELKRQTSIVVCGDTLVGLQQLGRFWRRKLGVHIVGVTGTNGKTTTKEFAAALLGSRFQVQYSKGSFNNHWGVPLSLLSIAPEHQVAVIEMGMNHPGEISELVRLAEPNAVAVTMVGRGHLEGVGSIDGVAQAKEEIYVDAPKGCTRIFNLDNPWTRAMYLRAKAGGYGPGEVLTFGSLDGLTADERKGLPAEPDIHFRLVTAGAESVRIAGKIRGPGGVELSGEVDVPVFGAHNVTNLMVATGFALACGMSPQEIWNALPLCRSGWGRNQWVALASGAKVLFDAYNANPESMRAALQNFAGLQAPGRKIAVLAEMREMGDAATDVHREMGGIAGRAGFDALYFIGPSHTAFVAGVKASGFHKKLVVSDSYEHFLASGDGPVIDPSDLVLMKGSRGMQLERVLQEWKPLDFGKK